MSSRRRTTKNFSFLGRRDDDEPRRHGVAVLGPDGLHARGRPDRDTPPRRSRSEFFWRTIISTSSGVVRAALLQRNGEGQQEQAQRRGQRAPYVRALPLIASGRPVVWSASPAGLEEAGRRAGKLGFLEPEAICRLGLGPEDDLHRDQRRKGPGHQPERRRPGRRYDQQREGGKDDCRLGDATDRKARIVDRLDSEVLLLLEAQL